MRGSTALNSPLGQVILVQVWHLLESLLHRFTLLSSDNTGHYWLLFCLALVSVNLIPVPTSSRKSGSRKGTKQTESQAWKFKGWGQSKCTEASFPFSKIRSQSELWLLLSTLSLKHCSEWYCFFQQMTVSSLVWEKKPGLTQRLLRMVMRFQLDSNDAQFPHYSSYCDEFKFSDWIP